MIEQVQLDDGSALAVPGIVPKLSRTPAATAARRAGHRARTATPCCARSA
jgi:hypothetical protein